MTSRAGRGRTRNTLGDVALRVRRADGTPSRDVGDASVALPPATLDEKRAMLAAFIRFVGESRQTASTSGRVIPPANASEAVDAFAASSPDDTPLAAAVAGLPRRQRETLAGLLEGDSEKQIALRLQLSPHTVHVYVKSLYRRFGVASRGELLSRWVSRNVTQVSLPPIRPARSSTGA